MNEEWAARRLNSPYVLRFREPPAKRQFLYCVTEYVDGPTLRDWMHHNPEPALDQVRDIVRQLAAGLRALHRMEMVHQDLKPENVIIDADGTVKIIDLGAVRIRGIEQIALPWSRDGYLGTERYAAPECLEGLPATPRSDRYALGVIAYELLTGRLPYRRPPTPGSRWALHYRSARECNPDVPAWVDGCLEKSVALNPDKRYESLSEFLQDLNRPNPALVPSETAPLIERLSLSSWKLIAGLSLLANVVLLLLLLAR